MKYPVMTVLFASLLLCGSVRSNKEAPLTISMIQLLANPERFDRKSVTVWGFLVMERQPQHSPDASLSLHEEDAENLLGNAVPVQPTERMVRDAERIDRMYVILTGTVRVSHVENEGSAFGIVDIQRCDPWSDPHRPRALKGDENKPR
jgi:hypothetical protein